MAFNTMDFLPSVFCNSWFLMKFLQLMLVGRVMTDGRLNARVKCDLTDNLTLKINAQVSEFEFCG